MNSEFTKKDIEYMQRALQLAKNGLGTASPNPVVGAVIVYDNKIIGEGWHRAAGEAHAEPNAVNSVKNKDLLKDSTIYVSLEPCFHFGKTPPCTDLIIEKQIPNVVIAVVDPFAKVCGEGINKLKQNGHNLKVGLLEGESIELNKRFFTVQNKNRPYVILKWAQSKDNFIGIEKNISTKNKITWISNQYSQQLAHKWRNEEDAVLVGTNTALIDNPGLTTRSWKGKNPVRVLIDRKLKVQSNYNLLDSRVKTIIFTKEDKKSESNIIYEKIDFSSRNFPESLLEALNKHKIQSIIIEGGAKTLQTFIDKKLWDEARVFYGSGLLKQGIKAPFFDYNPIRKSIINDDILSFYKNI